MARGRLGVALKAGEASGETLAVGRGEKQVSEAALSVRRLRGDGRPSRQGYAGVCLRCEPECGNRQLGISKARQTWGHVTPRLCRAGPRVSRGEGTEKHRRVVLLACRVFQARA